MRKIYMMVVMLSLGCASKGESEPTVDEFIETATPAVAAGRVSAQPTRLAPELLPEADDARWTSRHYNLTLQVDDPAVAMVRTRSMLVEAGATIQSASRQPNNGSLNVTSDAKTYPKLVELLAEIDGTVVNENTSSNAMGPQIRQLRDRLTLAHRASAVLSERTKEARGEDLDALMFLHELNGRERTNLETQIRSYWDQAGKSNIYVNFQPKQP